jgi:hypothetical protein
MRKRINLKRIPLFWTIVLTFAGIYLFLFFVVPYLSMLITGRDRPLPVPGTLMAIYLALAAIGLLVYLAADETRMKEFWGPVDTLHAAPAGARRQRGPTRASRAWLAGRVLLAAIPLLAGWVMYSNVAPSTNPPSSLRAQHPTIPFTYEKITNPFRHRRLVDPAVRRGPAALSVELPPRHGTPPQRWADGPLLGCARPNFRSMMPLPP